MDRELAGTFADGWTPEDIQQASHALADVLGGTLVCVWDYVDGWGAGGDAQLGIITENPAVHVHEISTWVWDWLIGGIMPPAQPGPTYTQDILIDLTNDPWVAVDDTSFARARVV